MGKNKATTASISAINSGMNGGDLGDILEDSFKSVASEDGMKSVAQNALLAMLTAGIANEISTNLPQSSSNFGNHLSSSITQTTSSQVSQSIVNGENISFDSFIKQAGANFVGSYGSEAIGDKWHSGEISKPTQLGLHFINGYITGETTNGEGMSGGVGAVVGEQMGEMTGNTTFAELSAGLAGGLTSGNDDGVYSGYNAGKNSVEWNFRFGKGKLNVLPFKQDSDLQDDMNLGLYHEHGFYDDGDNVGYFNDGTIHRNENIKDYDIDYSKYYDDNMMREAESMVQPKEYHLLPTFNRSTCQYNCQNYAQDLRDAYHQVEAIHNPNTAIQDGMTVNQKLIDNQFNLEEL